jgi:hypothetical protein
MNKKDYAFMRFWLKDEKILLIRRKKGYLLMLWFIFTRSDVIPGDIVAWPQKPKGDLQHHNT